MSTEVDIDSDQVIKVIVQYLRENNLNKAAQSLQDESQVVLGAVDNVSEFTNDILAGRWERVIANMGYLSLPDDVTQDIYELIYLELIDHGVGPDVTNRFLDLAAPLQTDGLRRHRLKAISSDYKLEESERSSKRKRLAKEVTPHVKSIPSGRLLSLISQALKWLHHSQESFSGQSNFNLVTGLNETSAEEQIVRHVSSTVRFAKGTYPERAAFSPNGFHLAVGSTDGLVELLNSKTFAVDTLNLAYQKAGNFLLCMAACTALAFSKNGELLACGDADGTVYVWRIDSGEEVVSSKIHSASVNSIVFHPLEEQTIVTASSDGSTKLFSIRSNRTIRDFKVMSAPLINAAVFLNSGKYVVTGASDGLIRVYDNRTAELVREFSPPAPAHMNQSYKRGIYQLVRLPPDELQEEDTILVGTDSCSALARVTLSGSRVTIFTTDKREKGDFVSFVPTKDFVYAVGKDAQVHCFTKEAKLVLSIPFPNTNVSGAIAANSSRSILVIGTQEGSLHIMQP